MFRGAIRLVGLSALVVAAFGGSACAGLFSLPKVLQNFSQRLTLAVPIFEPIAHVSFCRENPEECQVKRMAFRGGAIALNETRWNDLRTVNMAVNRSIVYEANLRGLAGEKWIVSPSRGDCNDYAVTKRHQLLARGWPSRALLLAEVVVASGEHHLVLVVRTQSGDLVLDSLNHNIKPWTKAPYRWVRMQTPRNPRQWAAVRANAA